MAKPAKKQSNTYLLRNTVEITADEAAGKAVYKTFCTKGCYGDTECFWLHVVFKGNERISIPLLGKSWATRSI